MTDIIHNFKLLSTEFIELQSSKIPIKVFKSLKTGFRVVLVDKPGSCCFGTIVVPTLCSDDSGLPHTLEHLIFCSSKNFPNRGYLEACSVRCLSNGTNAWTDNDHTAYTISTAGYEGMAYALPVFLDHVINPTLHDRDFVTEVYHIDGEGKQKGVVFSEMVSRETSQEDLLYRYLNKRLYRDTTTYSKECGGLTPDIAKLTNERIKNYHSEFYTLKNSTAILVGNNIDENLILEQLENSPTFKNSTNSIDLKHTQEFPDPKISPPLTDSFTVKFPADDDGSIGSIGFNWYGPYHYDLETRLALSLLLNFLTYDVSSPLQQAFVAIDHPWATEVYYDVSSAPRTSLMLQFTGVPYETNEPSDSNEKVNKGSGEEEEEEDDDDGPVPEELTHLFEPEFFKSKLLKVLKEALDNLNYEELKASIDHYQLEILRSWEKNPDSNTTSLLIPLLVADRFTDLPLSQTLPNATKSFKTLGELGKKPLDYWKQLGYDWLLESACSNVLAVPDPGLGSKLESERVQRQQETIKEIGKEKLEEIGKELDIIIEENKVKISPEDIDNLPPTPNMSKLSKLNITQNLTELEPKEDWPFPSLQIVETPTEFVTLRLGLSTKEIPIELYDYLVIFFALLYETEVRIPGEPNMTYQQVINKTKSLMESTSNTMGQSGDLLVPGWISDILFLTATGEPSKFEPMLDWMFTMLQFTHFTEDRVLNVSKVLLSDIDDSLRWGFTLCSRLIDVVFNDKHQNKSNLMSKCLNFVNQKKFLKTIISTLSSNDESEKLKIIGNLDIIRDSLFKKGLISGPVQLGIPEGKWSNEYLVETLQSSWIKVYQKLIQNNENIKLADNTTKPTGFPAPRAPFQSPLELSHPRHFYLPLATLTSSYCLSIMPCDTYSYGNDLSNPNHLTTMAINVLCKLISQMEGPLSERIRGKGYAYGAQLSLYSWSGAIVYQVWKSVDPSNSLKVFWDFLEEMNDETYFNKVVNQFQLDQTKSSMIYSACYKQDTSNRIVYGALTNSFQGYESYQQYTQFYNSNLERVTIEDVRRVFLNYLLPMTKSKNFQTLILTPADSKDGEGLLDPLKEASLISKTQINIEKLDLQDLINFY